MTLFQNNLFILNKIDMKQELHRALAEIYKLEWVSFQSQVIVRVEEGFRLPSPAVCILFSFPVAAYVHLRTCCRNYCQAIICRYTRILEVETTIMLFHNLACDDISCTINY